MSGIFTDDTRDHHQVGPVEFLDEIRKEELISRFLKEGDIANEFEKTDVEFICIAPHKFICEIATLGVNGNRVHEYYIGYDKIIKMFKPIIEGRILEMKLEKLEL